MTKQYKVCVMTKEDMAPEFIKALDYAFKKCGPKVASKLLDKMGPAMIRLAEIENAEEIAKKTVTADTEEEAERLANEMIEQQKSKAVNKEIRRQVNKSSGASSLDELIGMAPLEMLDDMIKKGVKKGELSKGAAKYWEDFKKNESPGKQTKH